MTRNRNQLPLDSFFFGTCFLSLLGFFFAPFFGGEQAFSILFSYTELRFYHGGIVPTKSMNRWSEMKLLHNSSFFFHQKFQVPKMEGFLNHIFDDFGGWIFPYLSRIYTAYIGEYEQFVNFYVCSSQLSLPFQNHPESYPNLGCKPEVRKNSSRGVHRRVELSCFSFQGKAKYDLDYDGVVGIYQLLPTDLLITQMEVTYCNHLNPWKGHKKNIRKGHWEEPGRRYFFCWCMSMIEYVV